MSQTGSHGWGHHNSPRIGGSSGRHTAERIAQADEAFSGLTSRPSIDDDPAMANESEGWPREVFQQAGRVTFAPPDAEAVGNSKMREVTKAFFADQAQSQIHDVNADLNAELETPDPDQGRL